MLRFYLKKEMEAKQELSAGLGAVVQEDSPEAREAWLKHCLKVCIYRGREHPSAKFFSDGSEIVVCREKKKWHKVGHMQQFVKYKDSSVVAITIATHKDDAPVPVLADQMHALILAEERGMIPEEFKEDVVKAKDLFLRWTTEADLEMQKRKEAFDEAVKVDKVKAEKEERERANERMAAFEKKLEALAVGEDPGESPSGFDMDAFTSEYIKEIPEFDIGDQTNLVVKAKDVQWLSKLFDRIAAIPEFKPTPRRSSE